MTDVVMIAAEMSTAMINQKKTADVAIILATSAAVACLIEALETLKRT